MLKTICFCDRCKSEINGDVGYIAYNFLEGSYKGDLIGANPYENNHYCKDCMEVIKKVIDGNIVERPDGTLGEIPQEEDPFEFEEEIPLPMPRTPKLTPEQIADEAADIQKKIEEAGEPDSKKAPEEMEPADDLKSVSKADPVPAKKSGKGIDHGKIQALRGAGWSVKKIAEEMRLTPVQVSNSLYQHKNTLAEPGK